MNKALFNNNILNIIIKYTNFFVILLHFNTSFNLISKRSKNEKVARNSIKTFIEPDVYFLD